ncbi:similar to prefoldin 2 [Cyanidioschyzon merolae strain 10D]|jgi:chaperonin cofactor prefoldin|uniref:Similar to prefoldin 2 n=1 Tax=Cyanidioschyzon merolae (strain NIES-3377 / 10D) TaxID=280699 RepID=M1VAI0_CYAM1|nr:similar to prefoldin 2 [Cyanidioschyzon merolae strain 10D]BAM79127.1 similar to prefoldin 2 [Cyanidioschyzon merolae strain 10D]|eukprot:XP_005535413.1 similar to prefoldin 2 [Cyanidioschyzon merolae strain 10D]
MESSEQAQGGSGFSPQVVALVRKVAELEAERAEYDLVLETLASLEPEISLHAEADAETPVRIPRRCWQQVGDVLLERRKDEVLPMLESQRERLQHVIHELQRQIHVMTESDRPETRTR